MSGSVNRVILIGNLCADPEVREFQNGGRVVNMRIATNESWRDKSTGERKEKAEYHSVAIFNEGLAKVAEQYLSKGSKVYVEGQLETRKWQDQSGNDRYSTEVVLRPYNGALVLLGDPGGREEEDDGYDRRQPSGRSNGRGAPPQRGRSGYQEPPRSGRQQRHDLDDEVPF